MQLQAPQMASLHFSTRSLSASRRVPALRELFDRSIGMEIEAEPGHAVEMQMHLAPGLRRARMLSAFTARAERPRQRLADGEDTVCLMIKSAGHLAVAQGRREGRPEAGDGVLLVYREAAQLQFVNTTYLSVRVPFTALAARLDVEAAAARCVPRRHPALSLLQHYVNHLPARIDDPQLAQLAASHVHDLMGVALGARGEALEQAAQRGVRAARLAALKAALADQPTLRLEQAAARQGVTPRYVQMLFEAEGTTFSDQALQCRLDTAHRLLTSPRHAAWSVAAIAFEAGFGDLSHFNRRFKRRYGLTPTELRRGLRVARGAV